MNTSFTFEQSGEVSPEAVLTTLEQGAKAIAEESAERFKALLPRVVHRVLGEGAAADEAIQTGGLVLNESVVVMRLNPDNDMLELFCDIGMPQPQSLEATYRTALELNLCRTYEGVTFGVHPESGRLVATGAVHMLLMADDEVCLNALDRLTSLSRMLRDNRTFLVDL